MPTVMAKLVWKLFGRLRSQTNISVLPSRDNSLVVQVVKNLPAKQETQVRSLGWEDPLKKGKATHDSILASRIPWTVGVSPWGYKEVDTTEQLSLSLFSICGLETQIKFRVIFLSSVLILPVTLK